MAGSSIIGSLRVVLGADSAALDKGLKDARSSLASFSAGMTKAGAAIGASFAAAATTITIAMRSALKEADALGKAAQKIGIPVEELSKLKHAADLSDVGMEQLTSSVARLSKNMQEASGNASSLAARAFAALNIAVKNNDGSLRSASAVMNDVADRFSRMNDGANKTSIAMALFGKSGAELIPMLNAGKFGLSEMADEAEKLGLVISEKTAKSAEEFNDNLTRLGGVARGIMLKVTAEMADALADLSQQLLTASHNNELVSSSANILVGAMKFAISTAITGAFVFRRLGAELSALWAVLMAPNWESMKAAWRSFIAVGEETDRLFVELKDRVAAVMNAGQVAASGWAAQASALGLLNSQVIDAVKNFKDLGDGPKVGSAEGVNRAKQLAERISELKLQARELRGEFSQFAPGFIEAATSMKLISDTTNLSLASMSPKLQELNAAMLQFRGAQLTQESLLPWQQFEQQLIRIKQLLDAGVISQETASRAIQKSAEAIGATWAQVSEQAIGGFAQLANEFGKKNKQMAEAGKALGIVEALINTYIGFTKALASLPPPMNYVAAAGVLAAGMAKVAAIRSQKVPSAATGGSFMVPGGISTIDNQLVQLNLAAGERVDVTPANENNASRAVDVNIQGIRPDDFFRGDMLRTLFESLNQGHRDGYRLRIA